MVLSMMLQYHLWCCASRTLHNFWYFPCN